jgi:fluoride exporter
VVGGHSISEADAESAPAHPPLIGTRGRPLRLHLQPLAIALVMVGGALGAAAREAIEQAWRSGTTGFPAATFAINLSGSFLLGVLLEVLVRAGSDSGWRRRARLLGGTGFCGGFTTYSTFALESVQLGRHGAVGTGFLYVILSIVGGLAVATFGIVAASWRSRSRPGDGLPVDPDVDEIGETS